MIGLKENQKWTNKCRKNYRKWNSSLASFIAKNHNQMNNASVYKINWDSVLRQWIELNQNSTTNLISLIMNYLQLLIKFLKKNPFEGID